MSETRPDTSIDVNIARKNSLVDQSLAFDAGMPLFSVVEINVANVCTRRCEFCPISYPEYVAPRGLMSSEVMERLAASLHSVNYCGMVIFSGFCEPLLHKALPDHVIRLREAAPNCRIEIITNGDLLTGEKARQLYEAGVSTLCVSVYDGPAAMERFEAFRLVNHLADSQMVLRRRFYSETNYGFIFSNRSGCIKTDKYGKTPQGDFPLKRLCHYPFYYTFVDTDGTVLSCPHDWFRKSLIGNVCEAPLPEIWRGAALRDLRMRLLREDRGAPQCCHCSTDGQVMGHAHVEAWKDVLPQQA